MVSIGDASAANPMSMNAAYATHKGAEVMTSEKVAINGAPREAILPRAIGAPVATPLLSASTAKGVYLVLY